MKILISLLLFTTQAFAIVTKNCPEEVSLEFESFSFTRGERILNPSDYQSFLDLKEKLKSGKKVAATLKINSRYNSTCSYNGVDQDNKYIDMKLSGSTKNGAVNPAQAKVEFSGDAITYIAISKVEKSGLRVRNPDHYAPIYFSVMQCSYECFPNYIDIGSIESVKLK